MKDFDIKPVCTTVEKPQANGPIERVHQVIHNMIVTKYIKTKTFDYIDPWYDILTSVACSIREFYHSTFDASPDQLVFGIDIIFSLTSFIDWRVIHAREKQQVDRDNLQENKKGVFNYYAVGDQVFEKIKGIIRKA